MRFYTRISLLLILAICVGSIHSCKNKKEGESPATKYSGKLYQRQFQRKLETINPGLKDPSAVIQLLEMTGAEFIPDLVNNSGKDSVYLKDSALAAINLGIYTVDLVYLLAYEKDEKADIQLDRARALAGRIGAAHLYDHSMYKRYRQAGVHPDTLIKYLSRSAEKLEHEYGSKQLLSLYTLFVTGEFIEKLHLTTSLLMHANEQDADEYWTVMIVVLQQQRALDDLILLLDQIREQEEGERFIAMMNDLKLIFMELTDKDELAGINSGNIAKNTVFNNLIEKLEDIRRLVINPVE